MENIFGRPRLRAYLCTGLVEVIPGKEYHNVTDTTITTPSFKEPFGTFSGIPVPPKHGLFLTSVGDKYNLSIYEIKPL